VDRALHIAEIETKRLAENQEMGPQLNEDHIMVDQNLDEPATDKGKAVIVDTTPPRSPVKIEQGSASSAIPPAVQMALEEMKNEMKEELRNEIDELRADMRADMNISGEAINKKIDEMMQFLQQLASQFPKH
jgi:2',3'-cyclic-nucleotide 2'-phosphodiesterase (5'-nucleotidase family)